MATTWTALLDPTPEELDEKAPVELHDAALKLLAARPQHTTGPRPGLLAHREYIFGVFVVPVAKREENVVVYQELDILLTHDAVLTVCKTPPGGEEPYDISRVREAVERDEEPGMIAFHIVDDIAERFLNLVDDLDSEIDELEESVERQPSDITRQRISQLRNDLLNIRRILAPTRDAVRAVVDDTVEAEVGPKIFAGRVEFGFDLVYQKLLRAWEGIELSRDLLAGVRDYLQAKVAQDQNDVVKKLTAVASLLLLPTFIVGVYGQNFDHMPELHWHYGYAYSWGLIVALTLVQLYYFRKNDWF